MIVIACFVILKLHKSLYCCSVSRNIDVHSDRHSYKYNVIIQVRIMEVLGPVIEQNSTDVSIATKLEVKN